MPHRGIITADDRTSTTSASARSREIPTSSPRLPATSTSTSALFCQGQLESGLLRNLRTWRDVFVPSVISSLSFSLRQCPRLPDRLIITMIPEFGNSFVHPNYCTRACVVTIRTVWFGGMILSSASLSCYRPVGADRHIVIRMFSISSSNR